MNQPEDDLSRALHRKVDHRHDAPLGMDDVQARAGTIQRRRRAAIGAGVAAALVVVVPTAIVATGGLDRSAEPLPPASTTPSVTEPTPVEPTESSPTRGPAGTVPFDVGGLPTGAPPAIEWSDGLDVHRADGSVAADALPEGADGFAPMGSGWVASSRDDQGAIVRFVGGDGMMTAQVYDIDGDLATSPDGEVVAWAEPDGGVRVVQGDGDEVYEMPPLGFEGPYDAVAVSSEDCQEGRSTDAGCTVFVNTVGPQAGAYLSTSLGVADRYDEEVQQLTAWSDGAYAGITAFNEDLTTCSAVRDPSSYSTLWDTCDHRLVGFSPDAAHLLGVGSIGDGFADGQVAILDAADGTVLVDLSSDEQHQTGASSSRGRTTSTHCWSPTRTASGQWSGSASTARWSTPCRRAPAATSNGRSTCSPKRPPV